MIQMLGYYVLPKNALTAKKTSPQTQVLRGCSLKYPISHARRRISHAKHISQIPKGIYFTEKSARKRRFFLERVTGIEPA